MVVAVEELRAGWVDFSDLVEEGEEKLPLAHPGEHPRDWSKQIETTVYALAKATRVPSNPLGAILDGKRAIMAATAICPGKAIGTRAEFRLGLTTGYDLEVARRTGLGTDVERMAARAAAPRAPAGQAMTAQRFLPCWVRSAIWLPALVRSQEHPGRPAPRVVRRSPGSHS